LPGAAAGTTTNLAHHAHAVHGLFFRVKDGRVRRWLYPTGKIWPTDRSQSQKVTLSDQVSRFEYDRPAGFTQDARPTIFTLKNRPWTAGHLQVVAELERKFFQNHLRYLLLHS